MHNLRKWIKLIFSLIKKFSTRPVISRMCNETNEDIRLLGNALQEASRREMSLEEKTWIDRIEALRRELSSSNIEIDVIDFGAGNPNLSLSEENMQRGRQITRTVGTICKTASMPLLGSMVLFKLIRKFKSTNCVELGTSLGISAAYEAAALTVNNSGRLTTLEGAETLATLAADNFNQLGLTNVNVVAGKFQDTLPTVLEANNPVDYVFVDGHHDEKATIAYFQMIKPYLAERSLIVFDDISWSKGMKNAWKIISREKLIDISIDLIKIGVCVIDNKSSSKRHFRVPLL